MKTIQRTCIANFLIGFGSILNFSPAFSSPTVITLEDDIQNMNNDLKQLGDDIKEGISQITYEYRK
ncbi:hypothetical protein BKK49_02660 [Rodentibacter rarus]|uniref:hypothetical protein n=1 Tax=Rodentibacter rarus TaxID=1908260 RepID=UPI00098783A6|nr:hypothetical protein [Rodentibacter rarus]OOF42439.1 hypothetical protein BKK49_02660 [Rodentibacter rarus]